MPTYIQADAAVGMSVTGISDGFGGGISTSNLIFYWTAEGVNGYFGSFEINPSDSRLATFYSGPDGASGYVIVTANINGVEKSGRSDLLICSGVGPLSFNVGFGELNITSQV